MLLLVASLIREALLMRLPVARLTQEPFLMPLPTPRAVSSSTGLQPELRLWLVLP